MISKYFHIENLIYEFQLGFMFENNIYHKPYQEENIWKHKKIVRPCTMYFNDATMFTFLFIRNKFK